MLVLTRRANEQIELPGLDVTFTVLNVRGNRVQIGIDAPRSVEITRPGAAVTPIRSFDPKPQATASARRTHISAINR